MKVYLSIARKIFAGTKYQANEEDIKRLAENMDLLERKGLSKLNKRLMEGGRGIWATIAEHNFAVVLVSWHCSKTTISYEPEIKLQRPPDFKVETGGITYWIQMKDLSKLERENRQDKIYSKIKKAAMKIKIGKFFVCKLSENFNENDISGFVEFITDLSKVAEEGKEYVFSDSDRQKTIVRFQLPKKRKTIPFNFRRVW